MTAEELVAAGAGLPGVAPIPCSALYRALFSIIASTYHRVDQIHHFYALGVCALRQPCYQCVRKIVLFIRNVLLSRGVPGSYTRSR